MTKVHAYAVQERGGSFKPFEYTLGAIGPDEVDIQVHACGICHSDLSMVQNDWGIASYPLVPGHEVVGRVAAAGPSVKHLKVGQMVGVGWTSRSCLTCRTCMEGDHNLCGSAEGILVGRHGGFADRVRVQASWASVIPDALNADTAGPLLCGGITVFNPLMQLGIRPTDRVGVIGIGGLGHLALRFLDKWGCEVTAFSSTAGKAAELRELGADRIINSRDPKEIAAAAGTLDAIISTVNVDLPWDAYIGALRPRGRLHLVGVAPMPIPAAAFPLIVGQKSISGTPLGSPAMTATMLEFCARHAIAPVCEHFPMSKVNEAFEHLKSGKARYRIVLMAGR